LAEFLKRRFGADVKIADQRDSTTGFSGFSSFENQFMPMLKLRSSTGINVYTPDVVLLGGDQVLNTSWSRLDQYGYGILSKHGNVMSYASSDGGTGLSRNSQKDIANISILKKFKSVSVREPSTAEFLKGKGIPAETHIDPIYLLTPEEWREYAVKPSFIDENCEFDFTYLIGKFAGERNGFVTGKDGIQEYICWGNTR